MVEKLQESLFPNLSKTGYKITSPESDEYNCIAWAAGENDLWRDPNPFYRYYWPRRASRDASVGAFVDVFKTLGYETCPDDRLEPGFEKVAIYANTTGKPTHVARQLRSGAWTSKPGNLEDVEHTLEGLTNSEYGDVVQILKRPAKA